MFCRSLEDHIIEVPLRVWFHISRELPEEIDETQTPFWRYLLVPSQDHPHLDLRTWTWDQWYSAKQTDKSCQNLLLIIFVILSYDSFHSYWLEFDVFGVSDWESNSCFSIEHPFLSAWRLHLDSEVHQSEILASALNVSSFILQNKLMSDREKLFFKGLLDDFLQLFIIYFQRLSRFVHFKEIELNIKADQSVFSISRRSVCAQRYSIFKIHSKYYFIIFSD